MAEGIVFWFGGLMIAGIIGFVIMFMAVILSVIGAVLRGLAALLGLGGGRVEQPPLNGPRVCAHRQCGHINAAGARFCGRCGQPLGRVLGDHLHG